MSLARNALPRRLVLSAALLASLLVPAAAGAAETEVPFVTRFESSGHGDLAIAANTLMTCPDAGGTNAECIAARNGEGGLAALNNNGYAMELVDVASDPATFDSSSTTLSLPAGATVQFAGLFYGTRTSSGTGGAAAPNPAARGTVLLKPPGAIGYSPLAATVHDSAAIEGAYTGFADVTTIAAAGPGLYTVANVQAGTGEDRYGGWSLVVAYANPAAEPHSIRVFEGLASIKAAEPPLQIGVAGLETPAAGSVSASVGVVAYEGDRGASGDRLAVDGIPLSDAANPATNVFNSSIAFRGADLGGRSPNYLNQFGFDADLLGADGPGRRRLDPARPGGARAAAPVPAAGGEIVGREPQPARRQRARRCQAPKRKEGPPHEQQARAKLDIAAPAHTVRPTAVVTIGATVHAAGDKPLRKLRVCTPLPAGLELLTAPGATIDDGEVCWRQAKLRAGSRRSFRATARVKQSAGGRLRTVITVKAGNAPSRRVRRTLVVRPLPASACARLSAAAEPTATASC